MSIIFRIFFFFTVIGLFALLLLSWFMQEVSKSPANESFEVQLDLLKKKIGDMIDELIPIDVHEVKILSWKLLPLKTSKKIETGYLQTIFQEKLFAYALMHISETTLLEVHSSESSYTYEHSDGNTKVFISGTLLGTIDYQNRFIVLDNGGSQYQVTELGSSRIIITSGDRSLAELYIGSGQDYSSDSDRLFTLLYKVNDRETEILIVLVLYLLLLKK